MENSGAIVGCFVGVILLAIFANAGIEIAAWRWYDRKLPTAAPWYVRLYERAHGYTRHK